MCYINIDRRAHKHTVEANNIYTQIPNNRHERHAKNKYISIGLEGNHLFKQVKLWTIQHIQHDKSLGNLLHDCFQAVGHTNIR